MFLPGTLKDESGKSNLGKNQPTKQKKQQWKTVKTWMLVWIHFDLHEKDLVAKIVILALPVME